MSADRRPTENDLVARIRRLAARPGVRGVRQPIGDDAAVLEPTPNSALVATTDLLLEGVHFRRRWAEPADIGWKALAVNVSDIAAMAATPRWALVALACPAPVQADEVEAFYEGALALCDAHDVVIVGGDTAASADGWVVNVTVLGEAVAPVLRSTARAGDVVAVTGALGRAAAGLTVLERGIAPGGVSPSVLADATAAHLRPCPRVAEARWLAAHAGLTAMMDLSDGLATDVARLAAESAVGVTVHVADVPVALATSEIAAALGADARAWATSGGEDYELLVTCARAEFDALRAGLTRDLGATLTAIGEVTDAGGVRWVDAAGRDVGVAAGFEHFTRA
jgi:thiamine-monophosphate kinase